MFFFILVHLSSAAIKLLRYLCNRFVSLDQKEQKQKQKKKEEYCTCLTRFFFLFILFQETKKGYKKVIATGSFDLDNYISEKKKSFEIKVTLIPSNKNICSGFIDFQLTSVMLVDGVP